MITARKSNLLSTPLSHVATFLLILAGISLTLLPLNAHQPPRPQRKGDKSAGPSLPTTSAEIARGKYIVEQVAMCPQCHTPRNADGTLDHAQELEGTAEFFQPPHPDKNWPLKAPRIGGDPPANNQDIIKLLYTGIRTEVKTLRVT